MDRKCKGRLILKREKVNGKTIFDSPTVSAKCTVPLEEHPWNKKKIIAMDISNNKMGKNDMQRKSVQWIYFEEKLKEKGFLLLLFQFNFFIIEIGTMDNYDLINTFIKENPDNNMVLASRDLTILKQNLKRKGLEIKKAVERLDQIVASNGKLLLREKVYKTEYN